MRTSYTILYPDGSEVDKQADFEDLESLNGRYQVLYEVKKALDGDELEIVKVYLDDGCVDMFVGRNALREGLPRNESATKWYRETYLADWTGGPVDVESLPWIAGAAVLFHREVTAPC